MQKPNRKLLMLIVSFYLDIGKKTSYYLTYFNSSVKNKGILPSHCELRSDGQRAINCRSDIIAKRE